MKYLFQGLKSDEVEKSRSDNGSNKLIKQKTESFWHKLKDNYKNPIIIILCVALGIIILLSLFHLTEWYEAIAIAVAVILATLVSTFSEYKNEVSFQKLQEEASQINNKVFRDGKITEISVDEIVVGDYVLLQSGDKIPADGKIVQGELLVNQASLTGESESVGKTKISKNDKPAENDFLNPHQVFRGSVVDDGEAVMVIEKVGNNTFYGQLAKELSINDEHKSPLQVKLIGLARLISKFGYFGATLIAVSFVFNKMVIANHFDVGLINAYLSNWQILLQDVLDAMVLAIIIIVAAVPEGLPMMIAIVLSRNMRKMLKEKVLVRKLLGIETAGSIDILFSDKTGTITLGRLESVFYISGDKTKYNSYSEVPSKLREILKLSILENSFCMLSPKGEPIGGNTSERALITFIETNDRIQAIKSDTETVNTIGFDSKRKFSASQITGGSNIKKIFNNETLTFVKGAIEIVLQNCRFYYDNDGNQILLEDTTTLLQKADKLADTGIRFIALASSNQPVRADKQLPKELTLIGIIGIRDEIRKESKHSIEEAVKAGIQVVMITGDRKGTAISVASETGLLKNDNDLVLTSSELNNYTDEELKQLLPQLRVVARALPSDKSRLVKLTKSIGRVVGMTGDGVNDSAALKRADVGFAMGSGSEVAKEAGDIVILDDNFVSITNAVRYGRTIFKSIRKFIIFQLTVNVAAVLTIFLGQFFGIGQPLTIIQILWINVIMDTLAALAFGGEPALERFMLEKPVKREASILSRYMVFSILTGGLYITAFSVFFLTFEPFRNLFIRNGIADQAVFLTAFFNLFVFLIMFNSFNARTEKLNLFEKIGKNKGFLQIITLIFILQILFTYIGGDVLRTIALTPKEWLIILLLSVSIIPVDLFRKFLSSMLHKNKN